MEILKVDNLSKVYGKGATAVHALDDVSFSIKKGEFVAIIGPSGSGKSTLMHLMGGVDRPRSEEHTSELQSRFELVCRLLLEKKKKPTKRPKHTRSSPAL